MSAPGYQYSYLLVVLLVLSGTLSSALEYSVCNAGGQCCNTFAGYCSMTGRFDYTVLDDPWCIGAPALQWSIGSEYSIACLTNSGHGSNIADNCTMQTISSITGSFARKKLSATLISGTAEYSVANEDGSPACNTTQGKCTAANFHVTLTNTTACGLMPQITLDAGGTMTACMNAAGSAGPFHQSFSAYLSYYVQDAITVCPLY